MWLGESPSLWGGRGICPGMALSCDCQWVGCVQEIEIGAPGGWGWGVERPISKEPVYLDAGTVIGSVQEEGTALGYEPHPTGLQVSSFYPEGALTRVFPICPHRVTPLRFI